MCTKRGSRVLVSTMSDILPGLHSTLQRVPAHVDEQRQARVRVVPARAMRNARSVWIRHQPLCSKRRAICNSAEERTRVGWGARPQESDPVAHSVAVDGDDCRLWLQHQECTKHAFVTGQMVKDVRRELDEHE